MDFASVANSADRVAFNVAFDTERQLRPAVIARKISCGNKTPKGAQTWQILASLAATCIQRATSFIDALARAAPFQARQSA